jgi:23S rRNA (guanosine2251-2'-O)-methyltransferase
VKYARYKLLFFLVKVTLFGMSNQTFYIYGRKPIQEQLTQDHENVVRVFISEKVRSNDEEVALIKRFCKEQRIPFNSVSEKKIISHVGEVNDQGVIALLKKPHYHEFNDWLGSLDTNTNQAVLILDHIEDTHNFGAILRTAAAVGVTGVIISKDRQAPVNATVFKTSAGAATRVPIIQVANINQSIKRLQDQKFWIACVDMPESRHDIVWKQNFDTPMAFVIGSEGKGVSEKTKELCDFVVGLPLENDVESLNVSVAAAAVLYEWKRQNSN